MNWMVPAAFFVSVAFATIAAAYRLVPYLTRLRVLDVPNDRSSHATPTPRGAGLAIIPIVSVAWLVIAITASEPGTFRQSLIWMAAAGAVLCVLSWLDDRSGLPPLIRLSGHAIVVGVLLSTQSAEVLFVQGLLPFWADRLVAGLAWIWFINLFNFMDGIDGISGVETFSICLGIVLLAYLIPVLSPFLLPAIVLAGAAAGFLWVNWHPAKIFLGDSGSVPLGFLLGFLLLDLAAAGYWAAAIILPLYYLADATVTLIRRLLRGERIWRAHRQHFYQQAVARGLAHDRVARMIACTNVVLIILALLTIYDVLAALAGAVLVVLLLLNVLQGRTAKS